MAKRGWHNGEQVYYPSFDSPDLYDQWDYHPENEAVQLLIKRDMAFHNKDLAKLMAILMLEAV